MAVKRMHMVRAEAGGRLFNECRERSLVPMRLGLGSLEGLSTRRQIEKIIRDKLLDWSAGKIGIWAGMLHRFQNEMGVGDEVITSDPSRRQYLLGHVAR